jgi:hypothetical protein
MQPSRLSAQLARARAEVARLEQLEGKLFAESWAKQQAKLETAELFRRQIAALADLGLTVTEASQQLFCSPTKVSRAAKRYQIFFQKGNDPTSPAGLRSKQAAQEALARWREANPEKVRVQNKLGARVARNARYPYLAKLSEAEMADYRQFRLSGFSVAESLDSLGRPELIKEIK